MVKVAHVDNASGKIVTLLLE